MKSILPLLLYILSVQLTLAQSYNLDASASNTINPSTQNVMIHLTPGIGYLTQKSNYLYGGIDFHYKEFTDEDPILDITTSIFSIAGYGGFRLTKFISHRKRGTSDEKEVGVFLDPRVYFLPLVPRRVTYRAYTEDETAIFEETAKGPAKSQLAFGLGAGIYFKPVEQNSYWAIRLEYSKLDPFEVLREMDFPKDRTLPGSKRITLGISLFH